MDEFNDVPGMKDIKVSRDGRVMRKHKKTGEWYEASPFETGGYQLISYHGKNRSIHRLVAFTYIRNPKPDQYNMVRHLDGNPGNNHVDNLAWGDAKLNHEDSVRHGTASKPPKKQSNLSENDVLEIVELYKAGWIHEDLAERYDTDPISISKILSGKKLRGIKREIVGNLDIGERNNQSKLNPDKVREIRRLRKEGLTQREIAEHFGVSPRAIRKILSGDTWSHVD